MCSQCIDRRFATIAAGLTAYDSADQYQTDVFRDHLEPWEAQMLAVSYVRFAQKVIRLSRDELLGDYPQLYDAVLLDDPDPEATIDGFVDVLRHHARSVLEALQIEMTKALPDMAAGRLLPTSLLVVAGFNAQSTPWRLTSMTSRRSYPILLGGGTSTTNTTSIPTAERSPDNLVHVDGEKWRLRYGGFEATSGSSIGVYRIAYLLNHPWTDYTGGELMIATDPEMRRAVWDPKAAAAQGLFATGYEDGGMKSDRRTRVDLQRETQRVLAEIDDARSKDQPDRVGHLNAALEELVVHVSQVFGLGGKSRAFSNTVSKQRGAVNRSVNRALKDIMKKHPKLAMHLQQAIFHKTVFAYRPDRDVNWRSEAA